MEEVFAFWFKYRPFFFQKGSLAFQWVPPWWQLLLAIAAVVGIVYWSYRHLPSRFSPRMAWTLLALRAAFFLLLLALLLRPSLVISVMVPKQNLLPVVVDNSASMGLLEENGAPRGAPVAELLRADSSFVSSLQENFHLRLLFFDSQARTLEKPEQLTWDGHQTSIASALERVLSETGNLPVGGVVLFSDGSDNSYRSLEASLAELKARKIPVHTVGIGPEKLPRDVEITQVSAPRLLMPETVAVARLTLRHQGFGGSRGRLEIREGTTLVESQEIHLPRDSETTTVEVRLVPKTPGLKTYEFRLLPLNGERIHQNNVRIGLVEVRNIKPRILYVEGQTRWEYKFIRQGVSSDPYLRLETLLRTALNKFYRQGIEEETTLAAGFPSDREQLFEYRGMILGSIESSFFTYPQMEMIRDFVSRRGGGFLMLGGSAAFSSGMYQNTPIEEILPVWLHDQASQPDTRVSNYYRQQKVRLELTPFGLRHPVFQLSSDPDQNDRIWAEMPSLQDWTEVREIKAGATVLAQLDAADGGRSKPPGFVFHRFGRGLGLAFLSGSSWQWQMLLDHKDQSHATFWRQLLRWLVSSAKDPVTVETEREIYAQNEPVQIRAEVNDRSYNRINDARVDTLITTPSGQQETLPLQWNAREDGVYTGVWTAREDGLHQVEVHARGADLSGEKNYGAARSYFLTSTGRSEYFEAFQKKDFLQKLAEQTGGRYYSLQEVHRLPEEILYNESQATVIEVRDLWDMPVNLLLLVGLLFAEWITRKRQGAI